MKKKLFTILLTFTMILLMTMSSFAADTSLIENLLNQDSVRMDIGIDKITLNKKVTTKVDSDASLIIYRINVNKDTDIKLNYNYNTFLMAIGVMSYDVSNEEIESDFQTSAVSDDVSWVDFSTNFLLSQKSNSVELKLKKGNNAIAVLSTGGTYSFTANTTSPLKTMTPFTINKVYTTSNYVTGTGVAGATVKVIDSNFKTYETTVKSDKTFKVYINQQEEFSKLLVTMKKDKYASKVKTVEVTNRTFPTFTVNTVKSTSTAITGKGKSSATVTAYVGSKKLGSSKVKSDKTYSIKISKQSKGKKITVKMTKTGYDTLSKTVTVK